ncbi:hydroxycarboxylic acid receptor 3-like [Phyllopteryx taeniolatus]|uniref:hydroxycarboxylic acid receptor 3-like n=1 Tax=Phyllopteryx taeniolatus TaxID=161469 RepID=UPI002AD527F0|nr:hydroxycarboxylic acid receptor 3-like [Phyllopteryx taeniolatus]
MSKAEAANFLPFEITNSLQDVSDGCGRNDHAGAGRRAGRRRRVPAGGHPAGGRDPPPGADRGRGPGPAGQHGGSVDLLLPDQVVERQHRVPVQPGSGRLPGAGQPPAAHRRASAGPLGVRRRRVPPQPLPDVHQPHRQHRAHDRRRLLPILQGIIILVAMHRVLTVVEFFIALALLLFCSVRISCFLKRRQMGKADKVRKAMRVCGAIVAIFLVCFLPTTVTTLGLWLSRSLRPGDCAAFYALTQLTIVSLGLNFLNSALDPIVYVFSSSVFRKELSAAVPRRLRCQRREDGERSASASTSQSTGQMELENTSTATPPNERSEWRASSSASASSSFSLASS